MDREEPPAPDDFELSDLENEAFIPNGRTEGRNARRKQSRLTRWMPPRLRKSVENLSKIKIVILLLCMFIVFLVFLGWINSRSKPISIPIGSIALTAELARKFSNSAIPDYVIRYAPLVLLDKHDKFNPSDLARHIANTHPAVNFTSVDVSATLRLTNLDTLNDLGGKDIYLTSNKSLEKTPKYLFGQAPSTKTLQTEKAISAVIIVVEKGNGVVDAFYMYFYTFNQGPSVYGFELGDHLGDWEHNMVRFQDGLPTAVWYSQHDFGEAFAYAAVEKLEDRPISYSAKGSHANYAVAGKHDLHKGNEQIPEGIVFDHTSQGLLWDPTLSAYYYTYSSETKKFSAVSGAKAEEETPVNYLYFNGKWGDQEYTDDMPGQSSFHGFHKWTGGPEGPWFKALDREDVCPPRGGVRVPCIIKSSI